MVFLILAVALRWLFQLEMVLELSVKIKRQSLSAEATAESLDERQRCLSIVEAILDAGATLQPSTVERNIFL